MNEALMKGILLVVFIVGIYFVATLFRSDSASRGVPSDMVGNCNSYGDCY